jgi:hypothetical protein
VKVWGTRAASWGNPWLFELDASIRINGCLSPLDRTYAVGNWILWRLLSRVNILVSKSLPSSNTVWLVPLFMDPPVRIQKNIASRADLVIYWTSAAKILARLGLIPNGVYGRENQYWLALGNGGISISVILKMPDNTIVVFMWPGSHDKLLE